MARKKQVKKRVSKKPKKTVRKKTVKKRVVKRKPIVKKPKIQERVIKALEKEVRKPKLEKEPTGLPKKQFREERRKQYGRFPRERKRFERRPQRTFRRDEYKSHGERAIAGFLRDERIHFLYEYPLAITDEDRKVRVWYPDFWLPELNIIIEYMGMKGKGEYDKASMRKKKIYNALKIDFIEITPGLIVKGNWKRFIAMKIISIMRSKNYLYNKMKTLSRKYRVPVEERAKEEVGLEILD